MQDRDDEQLEYATELAIKLGYVKRDNIREHMLVDQETFERDESREEVQMLIDRGDEIVAGFDDDIELILDLLEKVVENSGEGGAWDRRDV